MISVLTIVNSLGIGGIEKTLLLYLKENHSKKSNISHSICCYSADGVLEPKFKELNIPIFYIKKTRSILADLLQIYKLCRREKFDIIHSRFGFTSAGFIFAAKILKIPIVVSFHSTQPSYSNNLNILVRKILKLHTRFNLFITSQLANTIVGHSMANLDSNFNDWRIRLKFEVIYNGIILEPNISKKNRRFGERTIELLHIGSPRPVKNHSGLLKALFKLLELGGNYHLTLVGIQNNKGIHQVINLLNLQENVTVIDYDPYISKYFELADIFIFPSLYEGFGNVLIEAQYNKIPVCCSSLPSLHESVFPLYHRYFFDPNSVDSIIKGLTSLVSDLESNRVLESDINDASLFAQKFSIGSMCDNLNEMYVRLYENYKK